MDKTDLNKNRAQLAPRHSRLVPRGFTLVELLVVITIIGILAALITVAAIGALKKAQQTRIKAEVDQIATALEDYKNKTTAYPPNSQTDAGGPLDENGILNDVRRHIQQLTGRTAETADLARVLTGLQASDTTRYPRPLPGGIAAGEAVVFWLGGFSADPKYPISGDGGPSYDVSTISATDRRKADPIESRKWVFPFDVSRLGPRAADGYFDDTNGRYVEYTDPKGVLRRINFWQYTPSKSDQPYLYFDTSRHPGGTFKPGSTTDLIGYYDPPAATTTSGIGLNVYAFKKVAESLNTSTPTPQIQYVNPAKFQVIHCGLANAWDVTSFMRMTPSGVAPVGSNNPSDYLLFPTGPFVGDIADTIVNFTPETKIEDAQK